MQVECGDEGVTVRVRKLEETRRDLPRHLSFSGNNREVRTIHTAASQTASCACLLISFFFHIHFVLVVFFRFMDT